VYVSLSPLHAMLRVSLLHYYAMSSLSLSSSCTSLDDDPAHLIIRGDLIRLDVDGAGAFDMSWQLRGDDCIDPIIPLGGDALFLAGAASDHLIVGGSSSLDVLGR